MCRLHTGLSFAKYGINFHVDNRDPLLAELKATTSPNRPLKETLEQAQGAISQFKQKQWQVKGKDGKSVAIADLVGETAEKIKQYSAILGGATTVCPFFPSVVWGAFSMFLKVWLSSTARFRSSFAFSLLCFQANLSAYGVV